MTDLPTGWVAVTLAELGAAGEQTVLTGPFGSNLGREDFVSSGVPVLTIGCLGAGGISKSKLLHVSASTAKQLENYRLRAGDFLFSRMASVGRAGIVPDDLDGALFNYHLMRLRLDDGAISPRLLFYYVRGSLIVREYLDAVSHGATRDGINTKLLLNMPVWVPPVPEQRRIVTKIDSLCTKSKRARDQLDHVSRLAEKYKQTILSAAFRGDLTRQWRQGHGPDSQWLSRRLEDLIDEGPSNGWSPKSGPDATGALALKLTATTSGYMRLDAAAVKRIHETPPSTSPYWLKPGDLLVQRSNTIEYVGAAAIFEGPSDTYIYPDLMMRIRIKDEIDCRYIWRYLNSEPARQYFRERATGTAGNMPKINGDTLRSLPVQLPATADERREVVRRIETAFGWIGRIAAQTTNARELIDHLDRAVLGKAFQGELVPQDPSDEAASVLLERIRAERAAMPTMHGGNGKERSSGRRQRRG
jgi:type I restriction enzyme S subunit